MKRRENIFMNVTLVAKSTRSTLLQNPDVQYRLMHEVQFRNPLF